MTGPGPARRYVDGMAVFITELAMQRMLEKLPRLLSDETRLAYARGYRTDIIDEMAVLVAEGAAVSPRRYVKEGFGRPGRAGEPHHIRVAGRAVFLAKEDRTRAHEPRLVVVAVEDRNALGSGRTEAKVGHEEWKKTKRRSAARKRR